MYKFLNSDRYEITRDLILKNMNNDCILTVFDDTDISGNDEFEFMKVGQDYKCKISIYAQLDEEKETYGVNKQSYKVIGQEVIAGYNWIKIQDKYKNIFYVDEVFKKNIKNNNLSLLPLRYDIISVNGIDRTY